MNFTGLKCPVCGKPFCADDDIVVCPQCGAPYHRECYKSVGKCIYADRHGTADAWKPPEQDTRQNAKAEGGSRRCPRCGADNPESAMFCTHCGLPLSFDDQSAENPFPFGAPPYSQNQQGGGCPPPNFYPPQDGYPGGPMPFPFDPLGGVNPNDQIDGVPAGDIAQFVQGNTQYYLPVFMNLKRFRKNQFNFSAFLFPGLWMLYRKQYKFGAILSSILGFLFISYLFISQNFSYPIYEKLLTSIGVSANTFSITVAQEKALADLIYALPGRERLLLLLPSLIILIKIIIRFIMGFSGNRMYLKHCLKKTAEIRRTNGANQAVQLQQEGGVNLMLTAGLGICCLMIFLFFTQL